MSRKNQQGNGPVSVGDVVKRLSASSYDKDMKNGKMMRGTVVYVHPENRFHVVEFNDGRYAYRETFQGVER